MNKDIKYLVLSDIHLGNERNKTIDIINHLREYFNKNHTTFANLDIIFIAGDLYDKWLSQSSDEASLSISWLSELAYFCSRFKIKLRILEGTPSHDWKQTRIFSNAISKLNLNIDYKYIEILSIEKMDDLDISILYVPDEWKPDVNDTLNEVKDLLIKNNLNNVDIAIMHGNFKYQLPDFVKEPTHSEDEYLKIVKYFISVGHNHNFSTYNRIIAQGSFDRLVHGEEEPKGGVLFNISKCGTNQFVFIPNENATIFRTIKINTTDIAKATIQIEKIVDKLSNGSHVRISILKNNSFKLSINDFRKRYPTIRFTIINTDEAEVINNDILFNSNIEKFFMVNITKDNIMDLLLTELEKYRLNHTQLEIVKNELIEVY